MKQVTIVVEYKHTSCYLRSLWSTFVVPSVATRIFNKDDYWRQCTGQVVKETPLEISGTANCNNSLLHADKMSAYASRSHWFVIMTTGKQKPTECTLCFP